MSRLSSSSTGSGSGSFFLGASGFFSYFFLSSFFSSFLVSLAGAEPDGAPTDTFDNPLLISCILLKVLRQPFYYWQPSELRRPEPHLQACQLPWGWQVRCPYLGNDWVTGGLSRETGECDGWDVLHCGEILNNIKWYFLIL